MDHARAQYYFMINFVVEDGWVAATQLRVQWKKMGNCSITSSVLFQLWYSDGIAKMCECMGGMRNYKYQDITFSLAKCVTALFRSLVAIANSET